VTGIHVHLGGATENSHIHAVDLLTGTTSLLDGVEHGPIHHMDGTFAGVIEVDDLCPGSHGGHDDGGDDDSQPENDMVFDASAGTITGIWDNGDSTPLSHVINDLCSGSLYVSVQTKGYPEGAIRGQITLNNEVSCIIASSASGGGSGGGTGGSSGGGGARSSIMAPNLILYNSCSENLDGIMRIVTFNQPGRDLSVKLHFKEFSTWAADVSDEISYLKYIDIPSERYEYSVFDARFPTDLESIWVGLIDKNNTGKFIHHLVEIPRDSCLGYEEPFGLKDLDASIIKPIEPLEIPQPGIDNLSPMEIAMANEEKLAQTTFNVMTEHLPVLQNFEDPSSLTYHTIFFNGTWSDIRQCYIDGDANHRQNCAFSDSLLGQIELAKKIFNDLTQSTPVVQNFEDPTSLQYRAAPYNDSWNEQKNCYEDNNSSNRHSCSFDQVLVIQIRLAETTFEEITKNKPVVQNFEVPASLTNHAMLYEGVWDDVRQCYQDKDPSHKQSCAFADNLSSQLELAQAKLVEITLSTPVIQNFEEKISNNKIYFRVNLQGET